MDKTVILIDDTDEPMVDHAGWVTFEDITGFPEYQIELQPKTVLQAAFLLKKDQEPQLLPVLEAGGQAPLEIAEGDVIVIGVEAAATQQFAHQVKTGMSDMVGVEVGNVMVVAGAPGLFEVVRPVRGE